MSNPTVTIFLGSKMQNIILYFLNLAETRSFLLLRKELLRVGWKKQWYSTYYLNKLCNAINMMDRSIRTILCLLVPLNGIRWGKIEYTSPVMAPVTT